MKLKRKLRDLIKARKTVLDAHNTYHKNKNVDPYDLEIKRYYTLVFPLFQTFMREYYPGWVDGSPITAPDGSPFVDKLVAIAVPRMETQIKILKCTAAIKKLKKIQDKAKTSDLLDSFGWPEAYDKIFSPKVSGKIRKLVKFDYYDPDSGYIDDVQAYISAAVEALEAEINRLRNTVYEDPAHEDI